LVQVVDPAVEYLPAGHIVQLPFVPTYPALQMHADNEVDPEAEVELGGQLLHAVAPMMLEYLLASHKLHAVAPMMLEYLPASHKLHAVAPMMLEYCPTGHIVQLLLSP
jgi:hypothetical protein